MTAKRMWGFAGAALLLLTTSRPAQDIVLAARGESAYRIVVPRDRSAALDYAAAELQALLAKAAGVELPILTEDEAPPGPALLLGACRRAREAGLPEEARGLGEDGVLIKTLGDDVLLLGGGDRGQLYSVYELLQEYLGCRFLAPDCTVVPRPQFLTLPEIDHRYSPPFLYREELYHAAHDWAFAARLRLNGSNMQQCLGFQWNDQERAKGMLIFPFVHSASALVPLDVYFEEHPEYFGLVNGQRHGALIGGQLCHSNPEVLELCTKQVLAWLAEHPEVTSVDVSQNDAYPGASGACECERCRAIIEEEGAQHGPILRFVNAIAAVVAEKYPDKFVDTLAYAYTVATPKVTKPRANVIIRLCHHACYFHGVENDPIGAEFRNAIDDWRRVAGHVFIWHYGTNFWHYLAPNPNLASLARDIAYYAAHGVDGVMLQGDLQSPGGELAELRQYLCAQLLWDPARDPMVIREEFCGGYYGPAKDEVMEFLALMDRWGEGIERHIPMNGWHPPDITPAAFVSATLEVLGRALVHAEDPVHRGRVEKLMLPLWYLQLQWPEAYGVSPAMGREALAGFLAVVEANHITTVAECGPSTEAFLASMRQKFPAPKEEK